MRVRFLVVILALSSIAFAVDPAADRAALLKSHADDREGHLKGDANLITAQFAPTLEEVAGGRVHEMSRDAARQQIGEYLKTVKYTAWDDAAEPVIKISPDGQMAWMLVQTKVEVAPIDQPDAKRSFMNSAIQTYEKGPKGWQMTAIAATIGK
ncbi:MAG: hypothetical protein ACXVZX_13840 [Terriglobales bacterium]